MYFYYMTVHQHILLYSNKYFFNNLNRNTRENDRAINPCICKLSVVIFGKELMRSEIDFDIIALLLSSANPTWRKPMPQIWLTNLTIL